MRKLKLRRSIILYAAAGFGVNLLNTMMGSYLCSALLVGGFGEEAVPFQTFAQKDLILPAVWAVFVLVAKIIDGVIDIPMASVTDNLRSRFGRRRPSILIGFIPMILAYLLFLVIPQSGATLLNTVYYGVVLCCFYIGYTLTMVSYYATFTEIVETPAERNLMSSAKSVFDIFYFIVGVNKHQKAATSSFNSNVTSMRNAAVSSVNNLDAATGGAINDATIASKFLTQLPRAIRGTVIHQNDLHLTTLNKLLI